MNFGKLVGLTVVLVACAVWAWTARQASAGPPEAGNALFPDLEGAMNDVESVSIDTGDESWTVARKAGEWFLDDWGGYPAKFETVKELVVGVAELEIEAAKTASPERWSELEVQEPVSGAPAMRVSLGGANSKARADLVVGRTARTGRLYVRRTGQDQSWLVSGRLAPPRQANGWVERDILRLETRRVSRVVIEHPDGETLTVTRTGEGAGDWELAELPVGSEMKSQGLLGSLAGALARLDLDSVALPGDVDEAAPDWVSARYETNDGVAVTVRLAKIGEENYARVAVAAMPGAGAGTEAEAETEAEPEAEPEAEAGAGAEAETDSETDTDTETVTEADTEVADDAARSPEEIAAEVAQLEAKVAPWTFVISGWKADAIRKRLDDLVQPIEPPEEDPEATADTVPGAPDLVDILGEAGRDG